MEELNHSDVRVMRQDVKVLADNVGELAALTRTMLGAVDAQAGELRELRVAVASAVELAKGRKPVVLSWLLWLLGMLGLGAASMAGCQ